jgi:hypothetical protein
MKIKTSELQGAALDWAVAKAEGVDGYIVNESFMTRWTDDECEDGVDYHYSTDWAQGGPIIEREKLCITASVEGDWTAFCVSDEMDMQWICRGPTPLIAAMRCYVASKLGDAVEVSNELEV